ncbi:CHAP domain-containing protein [Novosphingopyxis sp.]|uniref:CHAP domain-containing protein n=1 Tax=Novosphingopyxis sp. TaxID=2709690 RepID=UPI003B5AEC4F
MPTCLRVILLLLALCAAPAMADDGDGGGDGLQCVPYAREVSGVRIYGDAHTWWGQAAGRYERGGVPQVGAVMAFKPHGIMRLGHVAAVSRIVDARTVLVRHSNWSTIDGRRGQIEDDVAVVDVSPGNDWSEVRVWYTPIGALGTTHYPLAGFIYPGAAPRSPKRPDRKAFQLAAADVPARATRPAPARAVPAASFVRETAPPPQGDPIGDLLVSLGR